MTEQLTDANGKRARKSHIFAKEANNHYVEPEWVSRRLFEVERFEGSIVDPACGWGTVVISALKAGYAAAGSDLVDRGWDSTKTPSDFLTCSSTFDNVVTNPPFHLLEKFITHAVKCSRRKTAAVFCSRTSSDGERLHSSTSTPAFRPIIE